MIPENTTINDERVGDIFLFSYPMQKLTLHTNRFAISFNKPSSRLLPLKCFTLSLKREISIKLPDRSVPKITALTEATDIQ